MEYFTYNSEGESPYGDGEVHNIMRISYTFVFNEKGESMKYLSVAFSWRCETVLAKRAGLKAKASIKGPNVQK